MPIDNTESIRRTLWAESCAHPKTREQLETEYGRGNVWNTTELEQHFEVLSFAAPVCVVRRKGDHQLGSVEFQHNPRLYYAWKPHN
jgi:hypothetical protein